MRTTEKNESCKIGDVIVTQRGDIAIVVDIHWSKPKYPVIYQTKLGSRFKGSWDFVKMIIGTCDDIVSLDMMNREAAAPKSSCSVNGMTLHPGDKIKLTDGKIVTFDSFNSRRPKYPITYTTDRGAKYKSTIESVAEKV